MGLFSCPHCNSDIDTNDKKSGHQVNDVIQETFCSVDCSIEYLVHNSQMIAVDQYEPYRVCRRVNILRDYPDDKIKIYP